MLSGFSIFGSDSLRTIVRRIPKRRPAQPLQKRRRRLSVEALEDRRLLASYAWSSAGGTLSISLATDEDLTIAESGSRTFALDVGTFTATGDVAPGNGTNTLSFAAGPGGNNIATSVSVDNSPAGAGTNNVTFAGGTLTTGTLTVHANRVGTTSAIDFFTAATTLGGNVSLTANGAGITDSTGSVVVTGTSSLAATGFGITLDAAGNDFAGTVSISGANHVALVDANSIDLGAAVIVGTLSVTATTGDIQISGKATVAGSVSLVAGVNIVVNAAIDPTTVTLSAAGDITINAAVTATTLITVQAGTDGTGSLRVGDSAVGSLATMGAGSDITVSSGGTSGDILFGDVTVTFAGTVTAIDQLTLTSQDAVTQTLGTITAANLLLLGAADVALSQAANNFGTIAADLNSGSVNLADADNIIVGTVTPTAGITTGDPAAGGSVTIQAPSGTITVDQPIDTSPGITGDVWVEGEVALNAYLTAGAGSITLKGNKANASDLTLAVPITTAGGTDAFPGASGGSVTLLANHSFTSTITGTITTTAGLNSGFNAGFVTIRASQDAPHVVLGTGTTIDLAGSIVARGADGQPSAPPFLGYGGLGGAVDIENLFGAVTLASTASITTSGGDGIDGDFLPSLRAGGNAGAITILSKDLDAVGSSALTVHSTLTARGGAASIETGGNGGLVSLHGHSGPILVDGAIDASAGSGALAGGAGGAIEILEYDDTGGPNSVTVSSSLTAKGGDGTGTGSGGLGGSVLVSSKGTGGNGDVTVTDIAVNGGNGAGGGAGGAALSLLSAGQYAVEVSAQSGGTRLVTLNGKIEALGGTGSPAGSDGEVLLDSSGAWFACGRPPPCR